MGAAADEPDDAEAPAPGTQRLDKWLWFARVVKSRTLAAKLIADGRIRVNRERVGKPSSPVRQGDVVTASVHQGLRVLRVKAIGARRGPAAEARELYDDLTPPAASPGAASETQRERGAGRPTKRERRRIEELRGRR